MGADKRMTENPHYFVIWSKQVEGLQFITFYDRVDCQAFVKVIHTRDGYIKGSLRIITGFELEVERDGV